MSLYSICRSVLVEAGWTALQTIATNNDGTAAQIMECAKAELEDLSQEWDWPQLDVAYAFNTVPNQQLYGLPDDFRKLVHNSVFNANQYYTVRGSTEVEEWNYRRHGVYASLDRQHFRLISDGVNYAIELAAPPSTVEQLILEYQSKSYATDDNGVPKPNYEVDTDVSRIPEDLIRLGLRWRFRRVKGMDYSAELSQYNSVIKQRFAAVKAKADIPVGGRRLLDTNPLTSGYVPDTGFGQP